MSQNALAVLCRLRSFTVHKSLTEYTNQEVTGQPLYPPCSIIKPASCFCFFASHFFLPILPLIHLFTIEARTLVATVKLIHTAIYPAICTNSSLFHFPKKGYNSTDGSNLASEGCSSLYVCLRKGVDQSPKAGHKAFGK